MTTELRSEFFLTKKGTTKLNLALFGAKNGKREGPLEEEVDPALLRDLNGVIRWLHFTQKEAAIGVDEKEVRETTLILARIFEDLQSNL